MEPDEQKILSVMKGLMRPLVRVLIARGVTAPAFYKLLKAVYVDVAHEEFRIGDEAPTDSRITLLTGVHRRDVRAILTDDGDTWETRRAKTAILATVLGQWATRRDYRGADGQPLDLPRTAQDEPSFEALVSEINRDIRPRTVLDELLRQDLVTETEDGLLVMSDLARRGPASDEDRLVFFATNVADHIAAASENLIAETPPFFERAVFYNQLAPEAVDQIEANARALSQDVLEKLNAQSEGLRADAEAVEGTERYRLGIYFYRENAGAEARSAKDEDDEQK